MIKTIYKWCMTDVLYWWIRSLKERKTNEKVTLIHQCKLGTVKIRY